MAPCWTGPDYLAVSCQGPDVNCPWDMCRGAPPAQVPAATRGSRVSLSGPAAVIILAAGEGTRMKNQTPKVLNQVCGRSMLGHVLAAARELEPDRLIVVTGHGRSQVSAH